MHFCSKRHIEVICNLTLQVPSQFRSTPQIPSTCLIQHWSPPVIVVKHPFLPWYPKRGKQTRSFIVIHEINYCHTLTRSVRCCTSSFAVWMPPLKYKYVFDNGNAMQNRTISDCNVEEPYGTVRCRPLFESYFTLIQSKGNDVLRLLYNMLDWLLNALLVRHALN
jgi:hypothetical protein